MRPPVFIIKTIRGINLPAPSHWRPEDASANPVSALPNDNPANRIIKAWVGWLSVKEAIAFLDAVIGAVRKGEPFPGFHAGKQKILAWCREKGVRLDASHIQKGRKDNHHAAPEVGDGGESEDGHGGEEAVGDVPDSVSFANAHNPQTRSLPVGGAGADTASVDGKCPDCPSSRREQGAASQAGGNEQTGGERITAEGNGGQDADEASMPHNPTAQGSGDSSQDVIAPCTGGGTRDACEQARASNDGDRERSDSKDLDSTERAGTPDQDGDGEAGHSAWGDAGEAGGRCEANPRGWDSIESRSQAYKTCDPRLVWGSPPPALVSKMKPSERRALINALLAFCKDVTKGAGGEQIPRYDARRLVKEVATRRFALGRARVEVELPTVLIYVDCSGSMTPVINDFAVIASTVQALAKAAGIKCVVVAGGNGGVDYVSEAPDKWVAAGEGAPVEVWGEMLRSYNPQAVLLLADGDGIYIYEEVAKRWPGWAQRCYQLHPHGARHYGVRVPKNWKYPWRLVAGVGDVGQLITALRLFKQGGVLC